MRHHPLELDRTEIGTEGKTRDVDQRILALLSALGIGLNACVRVDRRRRRLFLRCGNAA